MTHAGEPTGSKAGDVEELVFEFLDRREAEGPAVLEELCRRAPAHAARLRARVAALERAGLISGAAPDVLPTKLGEFRVLRRLGSGGMGVVFLAEQENLGRRAAIKVVRPEHLWLPGARERFRREALAVAQLSHPAIVPVYTVGEDGGVPFLAMEHVEGATLADLVSDLRGRAIGALTGHDLRAALDARLARDGLPASTDSLDMFAGSWVTAATRVAIAVAHALEHAHARGILHRDLKPSNVMIDREGRPRLLDFGLATQEGAERITRTGSQMGSMPYMAPEQVEGRAEEIDARTDVYGLAVTLYEALTLRLPYEERSTVALARRIVEGGAPSLRSSNPSAPADLEVVLEHALDRDVARRCASMAAFARDLENVLAHRPIEARRQGWFVRTLRWSQRHPAGAVSAVLGTLVVLGVPLVIAWKEREARLRVQAEMVKTDEANKQLAIALDEAREERRKAEENFEAATGAVALLTDVGAKQLADVPEADEARRLILEGALRFHQSLADRRRDRADFVAELAVTELRVGEILSALARNEEAEIVLGATSNALAKRLEREADVATKRLAFEAYVQHARSLNALGRYVEAAERYASGIAVIVGIPELESTREDAERWAAAERDRAVVLQLMGDRPGALEAYDRCGKIHTRLLERHPGDPELQAALAQAYLENVEYRTGFQVQAGEDNHAFQTADELLRQALPFLRARAANSLEGGPARRDLADALVDHGMVLLALGRQVEAEDRIHEALPLLREAARRHPLVHTERRKLSGALNALHLIYSQARCFGEAIEVSREAVALQLRILEDFPAQQTAWAVLGTLQLNHANDLSRLERKEEAVQTALESVSSFTRHLESAPQDEFALLTISRARAVVSISAADIGELEIARREAELIGTPDTTDFAVMRAACWSAIERRARTMARRQPALTDVADEALERMFGDLERSIVRGKPNSPWWRAAVLNDRRDDPRFRRLQEQGQRRTR